MSMSLCLGLGLAKFRNSAAIPGFVFTLPISSGVWSANEAAADADTRKTYVQLIIPQQPTYDFGHYRGADPAGNLTQLGTMTWDGAKYTRTSTGQATAGSVVYNRIARRVASPVGAWEWITGAGDLKQFTASTVPSAPTGTWAALSTGVVRVTLDAWVGNGRTVTSASYNRGAGATAFTPAAADTATVVDVTGLTDGVPTSTTFTWTNANGTSDALTLSLTAEGAEDAPPPPSVTYLINGSGTEATVYLEIDESEEYTGSAITEFEYQIDGGADVTVSGAGPLLLTGLDPTQPVTFAWRNATAYSDPITIELIASPPTYADGDLTLTDAADPAGDVLIVAIVNPVTVPGSLVKIADQYTLDDGDTWLTLPGDGRISTGVPETLAAVKLRVLYDIGPSVPSNEETATPTIEEMEPIQAAIRSRGAGASSPTASTTHTFTNPAGSTIGDQVVFQIGFDGNPGTLTVSSGTGWTISTVHVGNNTDVSGAVAFKVLDGVGDSLVLTSANSEQSGYLSWALSTWGDDPIMAWGTAIGSNVPDTPNLSFGDTGPFIVISGAFYSQSGSVQTAGPTGYDNFRNQNSATNGSASVRVCASENEVVGSSEDPDAYAVSVPDPVLLTMAFPPATSILPVTTINVVASAGTVDNGESLTFTANADGNAPITYTLAITGLADQVIVAPTNAPVVFTVTEPTGAYSGTLTAENPAGSAFDAVSFTVAERLVIVPNASNPFQITAEADSVISGSPASYDLEWELADGTGTVAVTQSSPDFVITFPASGAYRARVSETGGAWSIYAYYAVQIVGSVTYSAENVQAVQISPIALEAPVEMVPVTGKIPKVFEVLPPVATELSSGGTVHYTNGVMVNPSAFNGKGPQGWDSRKGGGDGVTNDRNASFDLSLINTTWPVALPVGGTISKALSRPTALLKVSSSQPEGVRSGCIDQHSGLIIVEALSTASPLQAPAAIIKHGSWTPGSIDLPGYQDMVDIITDTNLSTSGMTLPSMSSLIQKVCRFNPTNKLLRFGLWSENDNECFVPFQWSFGSSVTNYYAYITDGIAYTALLSDALTSDEKIRILRYSIMRGVQQDFPGNDARTGAGISQDYCMPVALSRIARGESFLDLATNEAGVSQRENFPWNYGYWTTETLAMLAPHDNTTSPTFARRRQLISVTDNAGGTGHLLEVPFNINARTGERQQRFGKLLVVRESTGETLEHVVGTGQRGGPTTLLNTVGFYATTPTPGEWFHMQIPASAMGGFDVGEPYWMYDTEQDADLTFRTQSYNPVPNASYKDKQQPFGGIMLLHALGVYPSTPGSNWQAAKDYHIKAELSDWPSADFNYPFSAETFVGQFWRAHAATLGITL